MSSRRSGTTVLCTVPAGSRIFPWSDGLLVVPPNSEPYAVDCLGNRSELNAAEQAKAIDVAGKPANGI
jgi:hypothetical protein